MAERCQLQRREDPITAEPMGCRKDVARLLTPKSGSTGHHRSMDVLVADGRAFEDTTAPRPGPLKSKVGHHRGNQTLAGERLLLLKHRSPEVQHMITIHHPTLGINRQHPICITVKGEAHDSTLGHHRLTQRVQLG